MANLTLVQEPELIEEQEDFEPQECGNNEGFDQQAESADTPVVYETPRILRMFMAHIRYFIHNVEQMLQTEERGNEIAKLQGYCAGHRALMAAIKESGYVDFLFVTERERPMIRHEQEDGHYFFYLEDSFSLEDLLFFYTEVNDLLMSEGWKAVLANLNERIQKQKDWLYAVADKGRDMHFIRGCDFVIRLIENWADCLKREYLSAKRKHERELEKKKEELPFDED